MHTSTQHSLNPILVKNFKKFENIKLKRPYHASSLTEISFTVYYFKLIIPSREAAVHVSCGAAAKSTATEKRSGPPARVTFPSASSGAELD